jgi:hypothetical protein
LKKDLYIKLDPIEFLKQFDDYHIEMMINEIPSERENRQQIYDWFESWVHDQDTEILEKLLVFITGTTRVPLNRKITVRKY